MMQAGERYRQSHAPASQARGPPAAHGKRVIPDRVTSSGKVGDLRGSHRLPILEVLVAGVDPDSSSSDKK